MEKRSNQKSKWTHKCYFKGQNDESKGLEKRGSVVSGEAVTDTSLFLCGALAEENKLYAHHCLLVHGEILSVKHVSCCM